MANKSSMSKLIMAFALVGAVILILKISNAFGQTVDLNVSPASGKAPLSTTLTWSTTGVEACFLDSAPVTLNGTQNLTLNSDQTFSMTCTGGKDYSTISWTPPTTNTDNSPIPATGPTSLAGFKIYVSTDPTKVEQATPIDIKDPKAVSYKISNQSNGTYYYKMTAYNNAGTASNFTTAVNNVIKFVSISDTAFVDILNFGTIATPVYNVVKKPNGFVLVQVGTVPLNTTCDPLQYVNGYYAVPVSTVTWSGTVKPIVVVAKCSNL